MKIMILTSAVYDHGFADAASIHMGSMAVELATHNDVFVIGQLEQGVSRKRNLSITSLQAPMSQWRSLYSNRKTILAVLHRGFVVVSLLYNGFVVARRSKVDIIYSRHGVPSLVAIFLSKIVGTPVILEVNGLFDVEGELEEWPAFARYVARLVEVITLPAANGIVAITKEIKNEISHRFHVSEQRIDVVPNGADTNLFSPRNTSESRQHCGITAASKIVCYVGNFSVWQGLQNLIKCAPIVLRSAPSTIFLVVGDGPARRDLELRAESLGIAEAFRFVGKIPHEDVPNYINSADVCVAPMTRSVLRKGGASSLKLHEYMACGKPIVASKVPSVDDMLANGCGLLVEPDDIEALASGVIQLLRNEELALRMGSCAREAAVKLYSWKAISGRIAAICANTIANYNKA